jgi:tetratricopeptide (TPR) repeat protein
MWLTVGLQKGNLLIIETLLSECDNRPTHQLTDLLLPAIDRALEAMRKDDVRAQARGLRLRGTCFESIGETGQALIAYEKALSLDPKSGVKRKVGQLRKSESK